MFDFACKKPVWFTFLFSMSAGLLVGLPQTVFALSEDISVSVWRYLPPMVIMFCVLGLFLLAPLVLSTYNICYLVISHLSPETKKAGRRIEVTTIVYGILCSVLYAMLLSDDIRWSKDWWEQLYNSEKHSPFATWTLPTILTIAGVFLAGYLVLRMRNINRLPPLLAALSIGGLYLGAGLFLVWTIQVIRGSFLLCLLPINLIMIAAKVIKEVICDWRAGEHEEPLGKPAAIRFLYRLLMKAEHWPWIGALCAIPLLGMVIGVLTLFGQAPDSIIQAWTQTSDWTFSQQVAPQNVYYDYHYLCTVAAGGHRKLVKPLREGKRHGHKVLVNRQLCVANAFEQLLQERLPRTHRAVRRVYDRYGYPIAKHIRSPYVADAVWLLMKPLECLFLMILYLFDERPENRIAVQYPHAPLPEQSQQFL